MTTPISSTPIVAQSRTKVNKLPILTPEIPQNAGVIRRHYQLDPSTRRWRRKATPAVAAPDLRQSVFASPGVSHLTVGEVNQLISLIGAALDCRYGDREVVAGNFWFPHAWALGMPADAFDALVKLLRTAEARLGNMMLGGEGSHDLYETHYLVRIMLDDLGEVEWQRNRRDREAHVESAVQS